MSSRDRGRHPVPPHLKHLRRPPSPLPRFHVAAVEMGLHQPGDEETPVWYQCIEDEGIPANSGVTSLCSALAL